MKQKEKNLLKFLDKNIDLQTSYDAVNPYVKMPKRTISRKARWIWVLSSCLLVGLITIPIAISVQGNYHNKTISFKDSTGFKTLNKVKYPSIKQEVKRTSIPGATADAIKNFSIMTSRELFSEEMNYIYSPLSLYFVLSMLNEGTSTKEAEDEINNLLGHDSRLNRDIIKQIYENDYYSGKNGTLKFANSIWVDEFSPVEQDYLDILTADYYAEAYQTIFDIEANKKMVEWIKYYTDGMVDLAPESLPMIPNLVCVLLNTLFFDGKWEEAFKTSNTYADKFFSSSVIDTKYMKHEVDSLYLETELYESVEDYFKNDISITYIRPKEGFGVLDVLGSESLVQALALGNPQSRYIPVKATISVPKFKYESKFDLIPALKELGVNKIFEGGNLQGIQKNNGDGALLIDKTFQNSGIEFSEEGVKAFSFTFSMGSKNVAQGDKIDFKLDRPFIYIISDPLDIPLFIGILDNPNS